jgi:hypothetical protein
MPKTVLTYGNTGKCLFVDLEPECEVDDLFHQLITIPIRNRQYVIAWLGAAGINCKPISVDRNSKYFGTADLFRCRMGKAVAKIALIHPEIDGNVLPLAAILIFPPAFFEWRHCRENRSL